MEKLVEFVNFHAVFGTGEAAREVVHALNFHIGVNEIVALVGESGSGKTVTAQAILRLQNEQILHYPHSRILFQGRNILDLSPAEMRRLRGRDVGMIFQEPMTSLNPLHRIETQLAESLALHQGLSAAAARPLIIESLRRVGLRTPESRMTRYPHELSGGERQRVMIALALINKPALLIADEPTTALDVTIQAQILALLEELRREENLSVLFITHDISIARRLADRVAVMREGVIVEVDKTEEVFTRPKTDYTARLIGAGKTAPPPPPDADAPPVVQARDIKVAFPVKKGFLRLTTDFVKAVDGASFTLRRGETLGVAGESGSGKTTLGKALLRLIPFTGSVRINGAELAALSERRLRPLRRAMQIIFQDPAGSLSPRMTVRALVGEGLLVHTKISRAEREARVIAALDETGLDGAQILDRYPHEFSGGQRQRLAIARSLVLEPAFLVLDEPTSSLDRTIQQQVIELLLELQARRKLTYLFISHDLRVLRALSHRLLIMREGLVVEEGEAAAIFENPQNEYTKTLLKTAFF